MVWLCWRFEAQLACREGADGELKFHASADAQMPVRAPAAEPARLKEAAPVA